MNITTTMKKVAEGLNFGQVCASADFSNVGSYIADDVEEFLKERGLDKVAHIFMADHSMGDRDWELKEGREPAYYAEDCFNGGWSILVEEDVSYLFCASATSGSSLKAEQQGNGTWKLTLEVPVDENDEVYKGSYWQAFHNVVAPQEETVEASA